MEISYTLIVALMFVTILSFGFAGLLTSLSSIMNSRNSVTASRLHISWLLIVLVIHFNMVWHATWLATIREWNYFSFLFMVLGPILAFFAAQVIIPSGDQNDKNGFNSIRFQFFTLFAVIQSWAIGADLLLERGITESGFFNIILIIVSLVLANTDSKRTQIIGNFIAWILYLTSIALRDIQLIQ